MHSYDQEIQTGPIKHTLEFWVERAIQRYKKWVKDRVVNNPDIFLGQGYLLECALNVASAVERDVQEMFPRAGRVAREDAIIDDDGQYIHLVGPGKYVEVQETFVDNCMCLKSSCVALDELTLLQACRWLAAQFRCTYFRELKLS